MRTVDPRAERFRQTREAHRVELAEDYVEVILDLLEETGEARTTDVAERIGVAHPTVTKALKRLEKEGLVLLTPYRPLALTEQGYEMARVCRVRHRIVVEFLVALGLDGESAETEAEGMEHHVSPRTLELMETFVSSQNH